MKNRRQVVRGVRPDGSRGASATRRNNGRWRVIHFLGHGRCRVREVESFAAVCQAMHDLGLRVMPALSGLKLRGPA